MLGKLGDVVMAAAMSAQWCKYLSTTEAGHAKSIEAVKTIVCRKAVLA